MSNIKDTTSIISDPAALTAEVNRLHSEVGGIEPDQLLTLDDSDMLYVAPADEWWRPASEVTIPDLDNVAGMPAVFADLLDLNGNRIRLADRPDGWFSTLQGADGKRAWHWYDPNVVNRLGDEGIIIGRGHWVAAETEQRDGELWVKFISPRANVDRELALLQQYLPVATAAAPKWADVDGVYVEDVSLKARMLEVRYVSRDFAPANNPIGAALTISSYVHMTMDGVLVSVEGPQMDVYVTESHNAGNVTANDVRALAEAMKSLADEFDRIS